MGFALYISGIHTIPKPLDTVEINLNLEDSDPTNPLTGAASLGEEEEGGEEDLEGYYGGKGYGAKGYGGKGYGGKGYGGYYGEEEGEGYGGKGYGGYYGEEEGEEVLEGYYGAPYYGGKGY